MQGFFVKAVLASILDPIPSNFVYWADVSQIGPLWQVKLTERTNLIPLAWPQAYCGGFLLLVTSKYPYPLELVPVRSDIKITYT